MNSFKMFKVSLSVPFFLVFTNCTTTNEPSFEKAEVIERIANKKETPEWTYGTEKMKQEGNEIIFIQTLSMSGNSRTEACMKAAEVSAKASFLQHIQTAMTSAGQLNDKDATSDPSYESVTAFISQGKLSGARTKEQYYEKRVESDAETGQKAVKLHCAVKVSIEKKELERQLQEALGKGGNKEIRQRLLDAQKDFIDGVSDSTAAP